MVEQNTKLTILSTEIIKDMYNRLKPREEVGGSGYAVPGPRGISGYSGISGIQGAFASSGYSGINGSSGYSGISGYSGRSGYSGTIGTSGISGFSGYSSYSGISGHSGASSYSGLSGFSGASSYSGISGYSGRSGYSGILGTSGISGYIGISGYSGYSSYSGYSGRSGTRGADGSSILFEYVARNTVGSEVYVCSTNVGITADLATNVLTFTIPAGVRMISATIRFSGENVLSINTGRTVTGWADRWQPNVQAWREDLGSMLPITVTMSPSGTYDVFQVNNLVSSATNYIKLAF